MKFYKYNEMKQAFENVIVQVEERFIPSTLPQQVRGQYIDENREREGGFDR